MPTLSLDAIQEHIAQKDSELRTLRREFEARQNRLQALSKRKLELHDQLGRIESKIAAATVGAKRPTTGLRPVTLTSSSATPTGRNTSPGRGTTTRAIAARPMASATVRP